MSNLRQYKLRDSAHTGRKRLLERPSMKVHLVNPSDTSFGTAVITPRWLYVLAAATPSSYADPVICDETLDQLDPLTIAHGDVVGIGEHTRNALRGYALGRHPRVP